MADSLDKMIVYLLSIYTQDELKDILGVSLKSIDNYRKGTKPAKKIKVYNRVSGSKGEKIPVSE